jgi:hypothetical protein
MWIRFIKAKDTLVPNVIKSLNIKVDYNITLNPFTIKKDIHVKNVIKSLKLKVDFPTTSK